jgi:hypothetical protein
MYSGMKRLVERKFYKTGEAAQIKLDVFFAVGRLEQEQYEELTELVNTTYGETTDSDGGLL